MKKKEYKQGQFCWVELQTTNPKEAKNFYGELLGWDFKENPISDSEVYIMASRGKNVICGMMTLGKEERDHKVPPHWNNYVSVKNADETSKKAKTLGGKILAEPFDVMDVGRMAVIQDPTGPIFCIWQPKNHVGMAADSMDLGSFCWNECGTHNVKKAEEFYSKLFSWEIKKSTSEKMQYGEIYLEEKHPFGGIYELTKEMKDVPPHWICYFNVENCKKSTDLAKKMGAAIRMDNMAIPDMGHISVISDPQGAVFGLFSIN
jgi:predicted enzyme related to lactoylglutathione lyase